jgi:RNA 2',3'-cyclic 3'-phosphodiesterase
MSELERQLQPQIPGIRWVPPENLHFTLKFLGAVDDEAIEPIANALDQALRPFSRFDINAKGLGVFPHVRRARVLWVGLEGTNLGKLAARVDTTLEAFGFARETRAFVPHLTIGRWRQYEGSPGKLATELERWKAHEFGSSSVKEAILFQSVLRRQGAVYHPLRVFSLHGEPGSEAT